MDEQQADKLVKQLVRGFDALVQEYQELLRSHQKLKERAAKEYQQRRRELGATPPTSGSVTSSDDGHCTWEEQIEKRQGYRNGHSNFYAVREAQAATGALRDGIPRPLVHGVAIHSGPSADLPATGSSLMPSISESPLEQDFTVAGTPSKLGCPFASMANKKLSSHAASIVSRYRSSSAHPSTPLDSVSRVNGRESISRKSSRRASFADPIKAEICGLSTHEYPTSAIEDGAPQSQAEAGVCPIRFLDQHSPEEVATYFEKHKHELPRSHEVCVKRYQSNEQSIRELDAKYGNLVSMIQGLGAKHQPMLPKDPDEEIIAEDARSAEKVRKWASNISAEAEDGVDEQEENVDNGAEIRQPHFERSLRDIRVGESPSRPWGIPVPARYHRTPSENSSKPAEIASPPQMAAEHEVRPEVKTEKPAMGCPFGFDQADGVTAPHPMPAAAVEPEESVQAAHEEPAFVDTTKSESGKKQEERPQMLFTGPVFIGYATEDAAKILRESGLAART